MPTISMFFGIQRKYVEAWIMLHEEELRANWKLLQEGEPFFKIKPLQ